MAGWDSYSMANEILNFFYRGQAISIGGSLYLRLLVSPSSRSGGGTETNYSGYARYQLPRNTSSVFTISPTNGLLVSGIILEFPSANSLGNGNLIAFDIVDTPSGAINKIYNGGPISPAKAIVVGKPPKFRVGALKVTF